MDGPQANMCISLKTLHSAWLPKPPAVAFDFVFAQHLYGSQGLGQQALGGMLHPLLPLLRSATDMVHS